MRCLPRRHSSILRPPLQRVGSCNGLPVSPPLYGSGRPLGITVKDIPEAAPLLRADGLTLVTPAQGPGVGAVDKTAEGSDGGMEWNADGRPAFSRPLSSRTTLPIYMVQFDQSSHHFFPPKFCFDLYALGIGLKYISCRDIGNKKHSHQDIRCAAILRHGWNPQF